MPLSSLPILDELNGSWTDRLFFAESELAEEREDFSLFLNVVCVNKENYCSRCVLIASSISISTKSRCLPAFLFMSIINACNMKGLSLECDNRSIGEQVIEPIRFGY